MNTLQDKINAHTANRMKWVKDSLEFNLIVQPHIRALEAISHATGATLSVAYNDKVEVRLKTSDLKKTAARLIEAVEHAVGDSFEQTTDYAEEWGASRTFYMSKLPIQITVELPMEGEDGCRRVQVGVKEVPIYKLECGE